MMKKNIIEQIDKYLLEEDNMDEYTVIYACRNCPIRVGMKCRKLDQKITSMNERLPNCPLVKEKGR